MWHNDNASRGGQDDHITCLFPCTCATLLRDKQELSRHLRLHNSKAKRQAVSLEQQGGHTEDRMVRDQRLDMSQPIVPRGQPYIGRAEREAGLTTGDHTLEQGSLEWNIHPRASTTLGEYFNMLQYADIWKLMHRDIIGSSIAVSDQSVEVSDLPNAYDSSIIALTTRYRKDYISPERTRAVYSSWPSLQFNSIEKSENIEI